MRACVPGCTCVYVHCKYLLGFLSSVVRVIGLLRPLYCQYSYYEFLGYFIVIRVTWAISIIMVIRIVPVFSVVRIIPVISVSLIIVIRIIRVVRVNKIIGLLKLNFYRRIVLKQAKLHCI